MGRPKFVMEDSFDSIFRDLERVTLDGSQALYEELSICIGEIIDNTPQKSGQAAAGWLEAAQKLGAQHKPVKEGVTYGGRMRKDGTRGVSRSAAKGRKNGFYSSRITGKTGKRLNTISLEAGNRDFVMMAMEYGFRVGKRNPYKFHAARIVRGAVTRMKERFGPHFMKALKGNIRKPKKKKKTTVRG